jgi:Transposase IS4
VLSCLVRSTPWAGCGRIVKADSYFCSFETALHLRNLGQKCFGVVETATRRFPMAFQQTLQNRGYRLSLLMRYNGNEDTGTMARLWLDRERRYFTRTTSSTVGVESYHRMLWRQSAQGAQCVSLEKPQPEAVELYCYSSARVDQHRRCCLELPLERNVITGRCD